MDSYRIEWRTRAKNARWKRLSVTGKDWQGLVRDTVGLTYALATENQVSPGMIVTRVVRVSDGVEVWESDKADDAWKAAKRGKNPANTSRIAEATNRYEAFTGNAAHKRPRQVKENERGDTFLRVGTVAGILYNTNRDGRMEKYIHHFHPKSAPELLVSHDGKVARTLGGRFTFTDRGFVDEDAAGNEIE